MHRYRWDPVLLRILLRKVLLLSLPWRHKQVLSIGETVEEVSDSGFLGPVPTLQVQLLVDNSLLQANTSAIITISVTSLVLHPPPISF